MVGVLGFEPRTSSLSGTRSNQLSYTPLFPLKVPPFGQGPRVFCFAKASGTFRGPRSPAFRAASPYSCLRECARPVIFLDFSIKVRQRSTATSRSGTFAAFRSRCDNGAPRHLGAARLPPAERRPRDVSPRSLARLNQSSVSLTSVSTKSGAEGARTLDILLAKQVL